ncbi:hypothetical protein ABZT49_15185 [Methylobacterium sp. EM32]|uniref:hypothetical protein n=1 Tax=Methylobacterium sp. EM32 TaxID=3163481 RepID=UPI0033AC7EA9
MILVTLAADLHAVMAEWRMLGRWTANRTGPIAMSGRIPIWESTRRPAAPPRRSIPTGARDAAVAAHLAIRGRRLVPEVGQERLGVAAAVPAHWWSEEEIAGEGATPARRWNAVKTAILSVSVG